MSTSDPLNSIEEKCGRGIVATSPGLKRRRLDLEIDLKEKRYNDTYASCCSRTGRTDARLIRYVSRITISCIVLGFACYQIAANEDPCNNLIPFYTSLITLVVGTWVKADARPTPHDRK